MTVKLYVSRDSEGRQWGPDHAHEAQAAQEIVQRVWTKLHHTDTVYALLANLHQPQADLAVISENGVGVIELKHSAGRIAISSDSSWTANGLPIISGRWDNPHLQVRSYAETIRQKTLRFLLPKDLLRDPGRWDEFKCQTAVCFTNPAAELGELKKVLPATSSIRRRPWESDFSVLVPSDVPNWAVSIRHGLTQGRAKQFEPYRIQPGVIVNVAEMVLNATEWTEILELMPDGEPWGYLVISDGDYTRSIGLIRDTITIGRESDNTVVVPEEYPRMSRRHAAITRRLNRVFIEDLSKNGTYVNGVRVVKERRLEHNQTITLGGATTAGGNYALIFKLRSRDDLTAKVTGSE